MLRKIAHTASKENEKEQLKHFVMVLRKNGDTRMFEKILKEFERLEEQEEGKKITVVSSEPISENMKSNIRHVVGKGTIEEKIEKGRGAGMSIFVGNEYVIDGTVKGKLRSIWQQLR